MNTMLKWLLCCLSLLLMATNPSHALTIRDLTTGQTLFNSHSFELNAPGGPALTTTGFWSNGAVTHDVVTDAAVPGPAHGAHYLSTKRDAIAAGNPRAFLAAPVTTIGNRVHAEWMMRIGNPPLSDTGFFFANQAGANIGQIRIGGNGLGTVQDVWGGGITSSAYQANTWQKWELDYTVGGTSYTVRVNGGSPINGTVQGASSGFGYLSFFHNGNQTYFLDGLAPSGLAAHEPQPQQTLKRIIEFDWRLGPRTPKGLQDSAAGIAHNTLISVGGFNGGSGPGGRGFHHETWGLDLANEAAGWQDLPAFPGSNNPSNVDGAGRQGMFSTTINDELYVWGGFNYTQPGAYRDGYKLSKTGGVWGWTPLPDLPTRRTSAGLISIGTKIYAVGGADYDVTKFYTQNDRSGTQPRYGAKMYVYDAASPTPGWQSLPDMPGTPRWVHAAAAVGDKVYVIGGASGAHPAYHTIVDNWAFDTTTGAWSRIRDLPVASGNFPSGRIVVDDRYILLVGGYQYSEVENPDGSTRPVYGTPSRTIPDNPFYSDIWVYDTQTNLFGTATPLPLNNNLPTTVYADGVLHMIGGEIESATLFGESFAHHPDLYLIGNRTSVTPIGDFNDDALVNAADIDLLFAEMRAGGSRSLFDVNSDAAVNTHDLVFQVETILRTHFGDTNLDGQVDITDLGNLASNWQSSGAGWSLGDFDGNALVDIADLGILATNWQAGVELSGTPTALPSAFSEVLSRLGLTATAVPEPSLTSLTVVIGVVACGCRASRRTRLGNRCAA
jgi:hypothetical protein